MAGGRRHQQARQDADRTERRERQWLEEQTRGTRREERATQEATRAEERFEEQHGGASSAERKASRSETQPTIQASRFAEPFASGATEPDAQPITAQKGFGPGIAELDGAPESKAPETDSAGVVNSLTATRNDIERSATPSLNSTRVTAATQPSSTLGATGGARGASAAQVGTIASAPAQDPKGEAKQPSVESREPLPAPPANERAAEVMRQFRMQLHPGLRSATIELAPADLGRIRIEMKLEGGKLRAIVRAEKPESLAALEEHLPELRAALEQQGLVADDLDLGLGFEGGRDERTNHFGQGVPPRAEVIEPDLDHESLARAVARRSGVDFYA